MFDLLLLHFLHSIWQFLELFKNNPLTDTQIEFLLKAKRGEFLLNIDNKNRIGIKIESTATERKMMGEEE